LIQTIKDAEIHILRLEREVEYLKKQVRIANESSILTQATPREAEVIKERIIEGGDGGSDFVLPDIIVAKQFHVKDTSYSPNPWKIHQSTEFLEPPPRMLVIADPQNIVMMAFWVDINGISETRVASQFLVPFQDLNCDIGQSNKRFENAWIYQTNVHVISVQPSGIISVYDQTTSAYKAGIDVDEFAVSNVTPIMGTINYKDHNNINQSTSVVVGLNVSRAIVTYRKGVRITPA
jgi:hypothetical protein